MQTEKEADEPRPAPMGSVDRALRLNEGLRIYSQSPFPKLTKLGGNHLSPPCVNIMYRYKKASEATLAFGDTVSGIDLSRMPSISVWSRVSPCSSPGVTPLVRSQGKSSNLHSNLKSSTSTKWTDTFPSCRGVVRE